jgi:molybdopterin/thiamine biosynthesis adenylyltransferase/rhodanese-related sulfurtransferase
MPKKPTSFSQERYARQVLLPELGSAGQQRLHEAKVLIVGLGGLGAPAALYLAGAGVGRLGLVDPDAVDLSNLHRQILYKTAQVGQKKVACARLALLELNPDLTIDTYPEALTTSNAPSILKDYDLIIDGTDNFSSRYLINDAAFFLRKPVITAAVLGFEAQLLLLERDQGPCYRCFFPQPPDPGMIPSCNEGGVIGPLPGVMGTLQAQAAVNWIAQIGDSWHGRLVLFDALRFQFSTVERKKSADCALCGSNPSILSLKALDENCSANDIPSITWAEAKKRMAKWQVLDVREDEELALGRLDFTHHIPLGQLEQRSGELDPNQPILVYCQSGGRSLKACGKLREKGFTVFNLAGGFKSTTG